MVIRAPSRRRARLRREAAATITITSASSVSVQENATLAHALTASRSATWSLVGGADQARFELSGSTLRWASNGTKDYEAPNDANTDNVYVVTVRATATSNGTTADQTISVTVTNVAEAPTDIALTWATGFAGGNVPDGTVSGTTIATISGTDPQNDSLTFSEVTDTTDSFTITGTSLKLQKAAAFADGASRNITIRASDGTNTYDETFSVSFLEPAAIDPGAYDTGTLVLSNKGKTATKIGGGSNPKGAKGKNALAGKSQFEFAIDVRANTSAVGIATDAVPTDAFPDGSAGFSVLYKSDGTIWKNGSQVASGYPTFTAGDTVLCAFNAATGAVWFGKGSSWQGSPAGGTGAATTASAGTYKPCMFLYDVGDAKTLKVASSELSKALETGFSPAYNVAPVITSASTFSVAENTTAVATLTATDSDTGSTLTWSITGGADSGKFTINSSTGALAFASAPDYETPTDADTNNVYVVQVSVTDGTATTNQTISVTITDVSEAPTDPYFSSVTWLLGFNGTNNSTTFTDESGSPKTLTAEGNAKISTAQSKFGGASGLFDGSGDRIVSSDKAGTNFGTGDFTIEFWVRPAAADFGWVMGNWENGTYAGWGIRKESGVLKFSKPFGTSLELSWSPSAGTWYHVAFSRSSGTLRVFIDGILLGKGSFTDDLTVVQNYNFTVGDMGTYWNNASLNAYLDELRITKGVARYTSDSSFSVPTDAYPRS
ncbi:LamG-like jellyroll fold domain-containing protein [Alsobacter sp. R-9]